MRRYNRLSYNFIDLFAGCGGLSLGLMMAGWTGLFAVEKDEDAFKTLKYNLIDHGDRLCYAWPNWLPQKPNTIGKFLSSHRRDLHKLKDKVDLIVGGPPCQGFSLAGRRKKDDPRNVLFRHYIDIVDAIRPKMLILENVRGIDVEFGKKAKKGIRRPGRPALPFSQRIKRRLENLGYLVFPKFIRASEFGIPQPRPRFILIAIQDRLVPRHQGFDPFRKLGLIRDNFLKRKGLSADKPISVRQVLSDLETHNRLLIECPDSMGFKQAVYSAPKTKYQRLLHGSMNGAAPNSLRLAKHHEKIRKRFANILRTCRRGVQLSKADRLRLGIKKHCTVPLHPAKLSPTLTTLPDDILHYSEPRILTVREYARLQSFPDFYEFKGKYTTGGDRRIRECPRYTQVGNAVPPFLAECLGLLIKEILQELTASSKQR